MRSSTRKTTCLKSVLSLSVGLSALLSVSALSATAQEDGEDAAKRLNTVTITATKREQTLQDTPVAVSVVDEQVIEKANIQDLGDLQSVVPSLQVGQLQSSANTNFIIRGFGNGANNAGIEPSVGVFIDGVYRSRSAAQISDLPNLQRVEVLRGPQSTLFGKNASAGVISIATRKPQFEQSGSVEAGIGNFNAFRLKGDITGPISNNVAYSASAYLNQRDGYADDLATGQDVNERNRWGVRGQLLFTPTEDLELRVIGDYDKIDELCCVAANLVNGPTGETVGLLGGALDSQNPFSYDVYNNFGSENDIENSGISLQADYALSFADLTSITAYRNSSLVQNADSDFTSADLVGRNFNDTEIDTFTQELRLTSNNTEGMIDWMVGAFYFDESVDLENEFFYGTDFRRYLDIEATWAGAAAQAAAASQPIPTRTQIAGALDAGLATSPLESIETALGLPAGLAFAQAGQGMTESFGQDNTAWSIFGTVDFHLNDRLTATVGLNYTEDEKDARGAITNTDVFSGLDLVELGFAQALAGFGVDATDPVQVGTFAQSNPAAFAAIQAAAADPAQNPLLGLTALQFLPPFLAFPNAVEDGKSNDSNSSYTLRLAYDATDNLNAYVSYATGFKATSWNLSRDSRPFASDFIPGSAVSGPASSPIRDAGLAVNNLTTGTRYAGPEESEVYEIGLKGSFDRFAFNVALFEQKIEGFQSNVFTGTGFALANAGEQSTTGVEFDTTWQATDNLTLTFAGTFLDPTYDSFVNSASGDISGQAPSGIPELSTSVSANYEFTFRNLDSFVRGDWQYEEASDFFDDPANQALLETVGYTSEVNLFNASAGFVTETGLGVSIWGRNIFDDETITTAFPSVAQAGSLSGYPNQPATYGVTVRKTF